MEATAQPSLPPVLIALLKGVLYEDQQPELWQTLLRLQARVRDQVALLGLRLELVEAEGYAFLQQLRAEDGMSETPRLVQRRQLSYSVSLMLALLRRKLAEHDAGGGDTRLVLSREQIVEMVRLFVEGGSNEAKVVDRVQSDIAKVVELGFLRKLRGQDDHFEVRRILRAFVDAQWLGEMEEKLAAYRAHLADDSADAT